MNLKNVLGDIQAFYAHAAEFGICSGITVPIRAANGSMSMFTLAAAKAAIDLKRDIDAAAAAAAVGQLHTRMCFLPLTPSEQHPAWLDPKEVRIFVGSRSAKQWRKWQTLRGSDTTR